MILTQFSYRAFKIENSYLTTCQNWIVSDLHDHVQPNWLRWSNIRLPRIPNACKLKRTSVPWERRQNWCISKAKRRLTSKSNLVKPFFFRLRLSNKYHLVEPSDEIKFIWALPQPKAQPSFWLSSCWDWSSTITFLKFLAQISSLFLSLYP